MEFPSHEAANSPSIRGKGKLIKISYLGPVDMAPRMTLLTSMKVCLDVNVMKLQLLVKKTLQNLNEVRV